MVSPAAGSNSPVVGLPENCAVQTVHFCTPGIDRGNIFNMSYFTAATQGLSITAGRSRQVERLFRDANTAWIERTDLGYELLILGERHSTSYTLEEVLEDLDTALLRGHLKGMPDAVEVLDLGDGVWGVDMADLVHRTRVALESL